MTSSVRPQFHYDPIPPPTPVRPHQPGRDSTAAVLVALIGVLQCTVSALAGVNAWQDPYVSYGPVIVWAMLYLSGMILLAVGLLPLVWFKK